MNRISIGQLRQNPTAMVRAVKEGETYVLTDRGIPVADITPHRETVWLSGAAAGRLIRDVGPDPAWVHDLVNLRAGIDLVDPWVGR